MTQHFVINGHGAKTPTQFHLGQHELFTPENLSVAYIFAIDPDFAMEPLFKQNKVNPVENGHWQQYKPGTSIPNVNLGPWQSYEARDFSKRLLTDSQLWSAIDGEKGLLLKRDPKAKLMIRTPQGEFKALKGDALQQECELILQDKNINKPIAFMSPKLSKVKILNHTDLAKVMSTIEKEFGPSKVLLATCNADLNSKKVSLLSHKPAQTIEDALQQKGSLFFYFGQNTPKVITTTHFEEKETNHKRLTLA